MDGMEEVRMGWKWYGWDGSGMDGMEVVWMGWK
jgi:hypothetical protein